MIINDSKSGNCFKLIITFITLRIPHRWFHDDTVAAMIRWNPAPHWVSPVAAAPTCLRHSRHSGSHPGETPMVSVVMGVSQNGWLQMVAHGNPIQIYQNHQDRCKWTVLKCFRHIHDDWESWTKAPDTKTKLSCFMGLRQYFIQGCCWTFFCGRQLILSLGCQSAICVWS